MTIDRNIKVLVVDDLAATRRDIIKYNLKLLGFTDIEEAQSGDVLEILKEDDFGLIVSVLDMARMNVMEFIVQVRADERLKDIPLLLVATEHHLGGVADAIQAGINYIMMPIISPERLLKKLEPALRGALVRPGIL